MEPGVLKKQFVYPTSLQKDKQKYNHHPFQFEDKWQFVQADIDNAHSTVQHN